MLCILFPWKCRILEVAEAIEASLCCCMQFANIGLPEVTIVLPRLVKVKFSIVVVVVLALKVMTFQAFFLAFLDPTVLYYDRSIRNTKLCCHTFTLSSVLSSLWCHSLGTFFYFWRNLFKVFGGKLVKSLVFQNSG